MNAISLLVCFLISPNPVISLQESQTGVAGKITRTIVVYDNGVWEAKTFVGHPRETLRQGRVADLDKMVDDSKKDIGNLPERFGKIPSINPYSVTVTVAKRKVTYDSHSRIDEEREGTFPPELLSIINRLDDMIKE